MSNKAYFHLPGLFAFSPLYRTFLYLYKTEREKFNDWVEIGSVFGAPRMACWGGGRIPPKSENTAEEIANFMKEYGISCRLTFSNNQIEEKHLWDVFCNYLLKLFYWDGNSIIINSPILEKYIREKFPRYNFISSTTKCLNQKDSAVQELNNNYDMIVLDYNFNKNLEFLQSLPNKDKCELLINPVCAPHCPRRKDHYIFMSKVLLHEQSWHDDFECPYQAAKFFQAQKNPLFISVDDIRHVYMPMGFKNFKIEGRTTGWDDLIEILLYYLIKPEYQLEIRERLYYTKGITEINY
jgi:collagenase-like PrtC family protease